MIIVYLNYPIFSTDDFYVVVEIVKLTIKKENERDTLEFDMISVDLLKDSVDKLNNRTVKMM
ncbi:unnamed protein product [Schistosoma mattheei]|uniref:Uncharacterized protein n=1 Tax=Schistosoma mattheei TaxID=31246 RepID=A0A3P8HI12_9TREM|nr:unnamed protein product [Schistosoma mattheei]